MAPPTDPMDARNSCRIIFETNILSDPGIFRYTPNPFKVLQRSLEFRHLTMIYAPKATTRPSNSHQIRPRSSSSKDTVDVIALYEILKQHFEAWFGPAYAVDNDPELKGGLEFFPSEIWRQVMKSSNRSRF